MSPLQSRTRAATIMTGENGGKPMAKYKFPCRSCGVSLTVAETAIGGTVICPSCGERTIVPTPEEEAARKEELRLGAESAKAAKARAAQERKETRQRERDEGWRRLKAEFGKGLGRSEQAAPPIPPVPPIPLPTRRRPASRTGFHKQRLGILTAAGFGMLGTFLPWVHVPILGSISGTRGDGWITLLLFVPAVVLSLGGDRSTPLVAGRRAGAVISAGLAGLIGVWKIIDFHGIMADVPKDNPFAEALSMSVQIGAGLYLLIAAGAALGVVAWAMEGPGRPREGDADDCEAQLPV